MERRGDFPRHRRISKNAVAWIEGEVADWMRSKAEPSQPVEPQNAGGRSRGATSF
jgi:predicted DNA-binding transcriptional regulator AlpA